MNRKIHITLNACDIREEELRGKIAVVIDVLRATTVIITALYNGAKWVKTVATIDEALSLRSTGVMLGGERQALPVPGFDFSNSPLEYSAAAVKDKGIVLTTSNGTLALSKCGSAAETLVGAFINLRALTDYLIAQALPVELICAGTNGEFSLDDFLCAGSICSTLVESGGFEFDDLGRLAVRNWNLSSTDIHAALSEAKHFNVLKNMGFDIDLDYCLQINTHNILIRRNMQNEFTK